MTVANIAKRVTFATIVTRVTFATNVKRVTFATIAKGVILDLILGNRAIYFSHVSQAKKTDRSAATYSSLREQRPVLRALCATCAVNAIWFAPRVSRTPHIVTRRPPEWFALLADERFLPSSRVNALLCHLPTGDAAGSRITLQDCSANDTFQNWACDGPRLRYVSDPNTPSYITMEVTASSAVLRVTPRSGLAACESRPSVCVSVFNAGEHLVATMGKWGNVTSPASRHVQVTSLACFAWNAGDLRTTF